VEDGQEPGKEEEKIREHLLLYIVSLIPALVQ